MPVLLVSLARFIKFGEGIPCPAVELGPLTEDLIRSPRFKFGEDEFEFGAYCRLAGLGEYCCCCC